jgi:exonuclease SbcC
MWSGRRAKRIADFANWRACSPWRSPSSVSNRSMRCVAANRFLEAQIAQAKQDLTEIEAQLTKWRDESERVARDLDGQRLRQRQLAAEGEVVTAETLRQARAKRSEEWTAIRRTYIDKTSGTDQLALGFDATKALPETFESAVGEADRQADLLRADTKRAAGLEECSARIEQMELRRKELADEMAARRADRDRVQAAWRQRLVQAGLPDLDPETLREWQGRRHEALQLVERVTALRADRDRLLADAGRAAAAICRGVECRRPCSRHDSGGRGGTTLPR